MPRGVNYDIYERPAPVYYVSLEKRRLAATVIATLAYPLAAETRRREKMVGRLVHYMLNLQACDLDGPEAIEGWHADASGRDWLNERLKKRVEFGRLILQPILAEATETSPIRVWAGRWNAAASMEQAVEANGTSLTPSFYRDWISPARPVAHLAAAWTAIQRARLSRSEAIADIYRLGFNPELLHELLFGAALLEEAVVGKLGVTDDILIRFRV